MIKTETLIPTILAFFLCHFAWGQDTISTTSLTGGKWVVCTDLKFSNDYQCDKGFTSYEFFINGTYKEDRQPVYAGKKMPFVPGRWTLNGNALTIDEDDGQYHKTFANVYQIVWLDSNRFYAIGPGGPAVYTYFQRTK